VGTRAPIALPGTPMVADCFLERVRTKPLFAACYRNWSNVRLIQFLLGNSFARFYGAEYLLHRFLIEITSSNFAHL